MKKELLIFFTILSFCRKIICDDYSHLRSKRFLIVPPTSPTRHQLISGIGIPLQLKDEAITLGLTMKAQYLLPDVNATSFKPVYFPDLFTNYSSFNSANNQMSPFPSYYGRKRRRREILIDSKTGEKYEKYEAEVKEIGNVELKDDEDDEEFEDEYYGEYEDTKQYPEINDFSRPSEERLKDNTGTRWLMYEGLSELLEKQGIQNGRECVLKAICDAADVRFTHHSGLFGEIFHILFSPSSSYDEMTKREHLDYTEAEKIGSSGESCEKIYENCKTSIMDIFTKIYV